MGRRPRYLSAALKLGYDVLCKLNEEGGGTRRRSAKLNNPGSSSLTDTDTDIVWVEDPFQYFPPGYDMYIASDKEGVLIDDVKQDNGFRL